MITLLLLMDALPFPSERGLYGFLRANDPALFPTMPVLSQRNRYGRAVAPYLESLRQAWLQQWGIREEAHVILDTKPIPVVGQMRTKTRSAFDDHATYGFCASRQLRYFGYTLVVLTTVDGLPVVSDIVPAHTDERAAAMTVLHAVHGCAIWADTGLLGADWFDHVVEETGNRVWTSKRRNQSQNPKSCDRLLGRVRQRIEGVFNELQHTGRHLERLLAKTVDGVVTRIATKLTHHVLTYLLRREYGIDILTFQEDNSKAM